MKIREFFAVIFLVGFAGVAAADLEPWTDYDISEGTSNVTTVKVDSNMIDKYLEGLSNSWAKANDVAIELGQIESYSIFVSELPNSGDFNVVLVTNFKNSDALQPTKKRYDAFIKSWGEKNRAISDKLVTTYPDIRTITGEYQMREIKLK